MKDKDKTERSEKVIDSDKGDSEQNVNEYEKLM